MLTANERRMKVDVAARVLRDVAMGTVGPALGHNENFDQTTIAQIVSVGNQSLRGIRCHVDHADQPPGMPQVVSDKLEKLVGFARNFRVDGPVARADVYLLPSSAAPLSSQILALADSDAADLFGVSLVTAGPPNERGNVRVDTIYAADFVDFPAANPAGLFAAKFYSANDPLVTECVRRWAAEAKLVSCWTRNRDPHSAEYKA